MKFLSDSIYISHSRQTQSTKQNWKGFFAEGWPHMGIACGTIKQLTSVMIYDMDILIIKKSGDYQDAENKSVKGDL